MHTEVPYRAIKLCNDCDQGYRTSRNKRLQVEICLIQMAQDDEAAGAGLSPKTLKPLFKADAPSSAGQQTAASANTRPAAQQAPKPAMGRIIKMNGIRSMATQQKQEEGQGQSTQTAPVAKADETRPVLPLDKAILMEHWTKLTNMLGPDYRALATRMKDMELNVVDGKKFTVAVASDQVRDNLNQIMPHILKHMRERFNNPEIEAEITLVDMATSQFAMSKQDILKGMMEKNSKLEEFVETFNLEFA